MSLLLLATCFLVTASLKILGGAKSLFAPLKYAYGIIVYWHIVGNFGEEKFSKWIKIQPVAHDYTYYVTFANFSPTCYTVVM